MTKDDMRVFEVCLAIHLSYTGASDPLQDGVLEQYMVWLEKKIINWKTSLPFCKEFDDAALALCHAAFADGKKDKQQRQESRPYRKQIKNSL